MNIGSLWKKEKDGRTYWSGVIQSPFIPSGEARIAVFPIADKKNANGPDFNIVWSMPKKSGGAADNQPEQQAPLDEDIPF
jgi:uncharacterized protein (DUF736 family)